MTSIQQLEDDGNLTSTWVIVTQVKSNRVVYFTDDPEYQPTMEGDWYYCSPYQGALPVEMTLRNCWGWRFNGGVFSDARTKQRQTTQESLIESNRKALLAILREKIDTIREPFLPMCKQGEVVRQIKLSEAQSYLELSTTVTGDHASPHAYPQLNTVAVARNISLHEAAKLIIAKSEETQRVLLETERFREQLNQAIHSAKTQAQLLQLREWLLDKVYPELSNAFKFRIENTEPINLDVPLGETQRQHEISRLKAQLREIINHQRASIQSDYIFNEEIRKYKARLAQAVLASGNIKPQGVDLSILETYAQARQLDLKEAAQLIVNSMAATAELLAHTESIKDRMLARIEAVKTLRDIHVIDTELERFEVL